MTNRSRNEGLSFFMQRQIKNEHIKQNIITSVGVDGAKRLVFTFRDGAVKTFARNAGDPNQLPTMVNSAAISPAGELIVSLSNGEIYNFGVITKPENFDNYVGLGMYLGGTSPLIFKPFLAGQNVSIDGHRITYTAASELDISFDQYVHLSNSVLSGSATSGAFRTRSLNTKAWDIPGLLLSSNMIALPKGKYYIKGWIKAYRTNYLMARLFDVTNNKPLINGTVTYAQSNNTTYNNSEAHSLFSDYIVVESDIVISLQAYYSLTYGLPAASGNENSLEIWKVS